MNVAQMCAATRADRTWLYNAKRLLNKRIHRTPSGARWWAMVRMLNQEIGLPLTFSAKVADRVLAQGLAPNRMRISASSDGSMSLQLDLSRFLSTSNALLASAFAFVPPRGRGRPKRLARRRPVIDEFSPVWEIRVRPEPEKLSRLAEQLREWEAYPRGIEKGLTFVMDAATLRAVPRLALATTQGEIDVVLAADA